MFCGRYYHSLEEMPIKPFMQCLSGDLTKVSKNGLFSEKKLVKYWESIFNQYLKDIGLPDNYKQYLEKRIKSVDQYNKAYNGQIWHIVKARIYEEEAKNMMVSEGEKIEKTCARISKHMGFPIKSTECSVIEFYSYASIMD